MEDYVKLKTKLQLGKQSKMNLIEKKDIDKIEDINVDIDLPKTQRIINFLREVKNPYVFIVDGLKVKLEFSEKGKDINQCFENLIINKIVL